MSHFTRLRTQMVQKEFVIAALKDLGFTAEVGELEVRGYGGNRTRVEIRVPTSWHEYDIGFRKVGQTYEMVADWYGIHGISRKQFSRDLARRYAYHAARAKLQEQRFELVEETVEQDGRIHLVVRRMV